jgi:uncharacterized protein YbbC (DUF1343 family)
LVNEEAAIGAALHVVPLTGWRRGMLHEETGLLWVPPSPNIPTADTALVYAGMVLIEGTNLSEGRGTARPFHLVGAPWLAADALARELGALRLPGCLFRPQAFMPTASKFEGSECQGIEVHVTDRRTFRPVTAAVALLSLVRRLHPGDFRFQAETFDRLAGTARLREALEAGTGHAEIIAAWQPDLAAHEARRRKFLLYP